MTIAVAQAQLFQVNHLSQSQTSALFLSITLASLQVLDGAFTSVGISLYGLKMEANPILRTLMEYYGVNITLALIKTLAILVIYILYRLSSSITWVTHAFKGLILLYLAMAIIPWSLIMAQEFLA